MFKGLIIEDDKKIAASISSFLQLEFEIKTVHDGGLGLHEIEKNDYDFIILDWMLPGISGIDILKSSRKKELTTPILMLSAKDQIEDKMEGFEKGADDYLTKPFYLEELKMRIRLLLKKEGKLQTTKELTFGDVVLFLETRSVHVQNESIPIVGKEYDLLLYLIENAGVILTKEQIFDRIWGLDSYTAMSVVEVYISKLRKHLATSVFFESLKTIRNVGYLLRKVEG
jgi:two-component system response regulator CiaR